MPLKPAPVWALLGPGQKEYPANWGVRSEVDNLGGSNIAKMYIYGEIGPWGVRAKDVLQVLSELTGPVEVHINSMGGSVFEGLAIYQALREYPHAVTVIVDGLAASAASFIMLAGNTIEVGLAAHVMIHEASALCMGTAADMRGTAEMLTKCTASIASLYAKRSGVPAESWLEAMAAETWYVGQEVIDAGLADRIRGDEDEEPAFPDNAAGITLTGVDTGLVSMLAALADPPVMHSPDSTEDEEQRERPVETDGNTPKGDGGDKSTQDSSPGEGTPASLTETFAWLENQAPGHVLVWDDLDESASGLFDHLTEGAAQ